MSNLMANPATTGYPSASRAGLFCGAGDTEVDEEGKVILGDVGRLHIAVH
jgi:hypothetical protein